MHPESEYCRPLDSVNQAVINKLASRADFGARKYGQTMDRTDLTHVQWLEHAQTEMLDAAVYMEKLIQEYHKIEVIIKKYEQSQPSP